MAYFQVNKKPRLTFPTLTGSIVTFNSQYAGLPLKSHKIALTATQSGSGTPSPSNPRAISGYDKIHVCGTGINLWGGADLVTGIKTSIPSATEGTDYIEFASNAAASGYFTEGVKFKENTQYTFLFTLQNPTAVRSNLRIIYTDGTSSNVGNVTDNTKQTLVMVTDANKTIRGLEKRNAGGETRLFYDECALLEGVKTFDDFVPYNGHYLTIQIGSTVYGGEYDARTGVLTVTHKGILARDVSGWAKSGSVFYRNFPDVWTAITPDTPTGRKPLMCSHFDYSSSSIVADLKVGYGGASNNGNIVIRYDALSTISDFNDYIANNDVFIVYPLNTPNTIQLPPCPIDTLEGVNNIWADTGDTTLQYSKFG